jgi:hypothetical protein
MVSDHIYQAMSAYPRDVILEHSVVELVCLFQPILPRGLQASEIYLAYVRPFDIVPQWSESKRSYLMEPEDSTGMYILKRARRNDGLLSGKVIYLQSILTDIEVSPKLSEARSDWTHYNAMAKSDYFYLNHYCDREFFYRFVLNK